MSLSDNITKIEKYAFSNCTNLKSVLIPDSVKVIGDYAFNNCRNLDNIELGMHLLYF